MATDTKPANAQTEENWEDVKIGLGHEWDLEEDGPITGVYRGSQSMEVDDNNNPGEKRTTMAYAIEIPEGDDPNRFVWGSHNLDQAFESVEVGDKVRITYIGLDQFKGKTGTPQTVKNYRVQVQRQTVA